MIKKRFITLGIIFIILISGIASGSLVIKTINKIDDNEIPNFNLNSSNIIFVDDDREPEWYDETHVKTIQEGIENASHYDTVFVYNGTYYENVIIHKRIKLVGEEKNNTIIDGLQKGNVVSFLINGIEFSEFTVRNGSKKFLGDNSGIVIASHDNKIYNNIITKNLQGVLLIGKNNSIYNNNINENKHPFLPRQGVGVILFNTNNNYIDKNIIVKNSNGILISSSNENNVTNNVIKFCKIGIGIQKSSINNSIVANKLSFNKIGISIFESEKNEVKGNDIRYNYEGLILTYSADNKIVMNNFILNIISAKFQFEERKHCDNEWDKNYWKRPRILPYPIIGVKIILIPFINKVIKLRVIKLDWHPALKPYAV